MIDNNYNNKFRIFFKKFYKQYSLLDKKIDKNFLWELVVNFIEKNRDFVMQYPIVQYWENINSEESKYYEKIFFSKYSGKELNIYFHIPFCKTRCTYCNFHIISGDKNKDLMSHIYINKLKKEIDLFLKNVSNFKIKTIFIGGGTPSYLDEKYLEDLLSYINKKFEKNYSKNIEICFEGNPDSFNIKKLEILKKNNVNRLSFGVQTFNKNILKNINRTYDEKTVYNIIELAKKMRFDNINIDMIYGLPGHNNEIMLSDLNTVSSLNIDHITYYPLYYYDEAILNKSSKKENNLKQIYNFYDIIIKKLEKNNFKQYGREYFCKGNKISNYQNNYVSNGLLYGFGQSAYSYNGEYAFKKDVDLKKYLSNNNNLVNYFKYDSENKNRRLFVLGSRNIKIQKSKIENLQNIDYIKKIIKICSELMLIKEFDTYYKLTKKGLKYQEILAHMFV